MTLGTGSVALEMGTLQQPTIEVPSLVIDGLWLDIERTAQGTNYEKILENLERFDTGEAEPAEPTEPSEPPPPGAQKQKGKPAQD